MRSGHASNLDLLRVIVAAALLFASMPSMIGVSVLGSGPAFTADICHPLQTLSNAPGVSLTALVSAPVTPEPPAARETIEPKNAISPTRLAEAPDPPPPKTLP
jgi:hypothetical protein